MVEDNKIPEVYTDSFTVAVNPFGVAFTFGVNTARPTTGLVTPAKDVAIVRMSLEHAKVLAMLLRRDLRNYEINNKLEIPLPAQVYTQLGIAKEDWS